MDLFSSVRELHGVGPARAAQLEKLGIRTLYDLLAFFPRDYEDRTNPVTIAQLQPGVPACFRAMVVSQPVLRRIGGGRDITKLIVADETGKLTLSYFNQPYVKNQLHYGESYYFYGALQPEHGMQMANPAHDPADRPRRRDEPAAAGLFADGGTFQPPDDPVRAAGAGVRGGAAAGDPAGTGPAGI